MIHNIPQVVDIGCGEGELLACLAQPAPWLRPPLQSLRSKSTRSDSDHNLTEPVDPDDCEIANLHCTNIQGLDISSSDLEYAVLGTTPPQSDRQHVRWEPLEAKIWHGGLESVNPAFVNVECIVSTEVYVTNVSYNDGCHALMLVRCQYRTPPSVHSPDLCAHAPRNLPPTPSPHHHSFLHIQRSLYVPQRLRTFWVSRPHRAHEPGLPAP